MEKAGWSVSKENVSQQGDTKIRKKLFTMKLTDCGSMRVYIKRMTEIFDELAVVAEVVTDEDKVVYLLAGLPESYDVFVTILESGTDTIPALESMTERLLREEQKLKGKETAEGSGRIFLTNDHSRRKLFTCHFCKKPGHYMRNCRKFAQAQAGKKDKHQNREQPSLQDAMLITHALVAKSTNDWIVDSGATCHMCNDQTAFSKMEELVSSDKATLGDGSSLKVMGEGTVNTEMILPDGSSSECALQKVLYVPDLAYNLVSISKATESGKVVQFNSSGCRFMNHRKETIAFVEKHDNLFLLKAKESRISANTVFRQNKLRLWHHRFGHLNTQSIR